MRKVKTLNEIHTGLNNQSKFYLDSDNGLKELNVVKLATSSLSDIINYVTDGKLYIDSEY